MHGDGAGRPGRLDGGDDERVTIEFSAAMNPASLTPSTVRLLVGGSPLAGTAVTYLPATRSVQITVAGLKESHVHDILVTEEAPNYPHGGG